MWKPFSWTSLGVLVVFLILVASGVVAGQTMTTKDAAAANTIGKCWMEYADGRIEPMHDCQLTYTLPAPVAVSKDVLGCIEDGFVHGVQNDDLGFASAKFCLRIMKNEFARMQAENTGFRARVKQLTAENKKLKDKLERR